MILTIMRLTIGKAVKPRVADVLGIPLNEIWIIERLEDVL